MYAVTTVWEVRSDGFSQDRGVGAGLMLSPHQRESSGQQADLSALGGGALGMHALAQTEDGIPARGKDNSCAGGEVRG